MGSDERLVGVDEVDAWVQAGGGDGEAQTVRCTIFSEQKQVVTSRDLDQRHEILPGS